jgi:hypothetical protein
LRATATVARLDCAPWWLHTSDLTINYLKQCALPSHTILVNDGLTIGPLLIRLNPGWIPLGKCALEIPPSESDDMGLKLSTLSSSKMGRKNFPSSDLMITRESKMHPPQLSHPQWVSNVPKMISSSESDEKRGNRCILPSSHLSQKGITGFSLTGTSRTPLMLSSCALYLDKCTLIDANWITTVEVRWKIWMIFSVTRYVSQHRNQPLGVFFLESTKLWVHLNLRFASLLNCQVKFFIIMN